LKALNISVPSVGDKAKQFAMNCVAAVGRSQELVKLTALVSDARKALNNPEDRLTIMKTFRKNPTLAKYGVAYGAMEMGDPIAKEALRQCGLNDMVLVNEGTNADKVVRYLEAKYNDDIKLVGVISKFAPDAVFVILGDDCDDDVLHGSRGWLIAQGREYFNLAVQDADALANSDLQLRQRKSCDLFVFSRLNTNCFRYDFQKTFFSYLMTESENLKLTSVMRNLLRVG
jgi:hypothetical protein